MKLNSKWWHALLNSIPFFIAIYKEFKDNPPPIPSITTEHGTVTLEPGFTPEDRELAERR